METPSFIAQKAQELCFALVRISSSMRRRELSRTIERLSYHLLENASYDNSEMTISTISALRNFVLLGKNIYEIDPANAKIIERELERLENEIRRRAGVNELPDLQTIFTQPVEIRQVKKGKSRNAAKEELPE